MKKIIGVLIGLCFIARVVVIVFSPLAIIWAINHLVTSLFVTATPIPYSFWSWLAVLTLQCTLFYKPIVQKVKQV